jgi:DNA-binding SARP family transcriptional activator/predicted ATPase
MKAEQVQPAWRIDALGPLRITGPDGGLSIPRGHALRCLAVLILHTSVPLTRERLIDIIWPEATLEEGRRRLSDALYRLRRAGFERLVAVDGEQVALRTERVTVDVWEFRRLVAAGDLASLRTAATLYRDDVVPELYDEWLIVPRVQLHEQFRDCLMQLGRLAEAESDFVTAGGAYRRLIEVDPLSEAAYRGLMRGLAREGQYREALDTATNLTQVLAEELDVVPTAETQRLTETIRSEYELARLRETQPTTAMPFVGRATERLQLINLLERAIAGQGTAAIVLGDAGIGKTRLLREVSLAAAWRGSQVVWGEGEDLRLPPPLAPLAAALAAALPLPRRQQLAHLVPGEWLNLVLQIVAGSAGDAAPNPSRPVFDQVVAAVAGVLQGLAQISPLVVLLDDVQWADANLWPLLERLIPYLQQSHVLLILSGRGAELRAHAQARPLIDSWVRDGMPLIHLDGLEASELLQLAQSRSGASLEPERLTQIADASGGNPLFALALLDAGDIGQTPTIPTFADLIARRVAFLSASARQALQAAAVIGTQIDYELWEAMLMGAGLEPGGLARLIGELEQSNVVQLEPTGYRFAHDLLRSSIYNRCSPTERRKWHRLVLDVLQARPEADPLDLLFHAKQLDSGYDTARHALAAGQRALTGFSYQTASNLFREALAGLTAPSERFTAALGLAQALDVLAARDEQRQVVVLLSDLASMLNTVQAQAEAAWHRLNLAWITGSFAEARRIAADGLPAARQADDWQTEARLLEFDGRAARDLGEYESAIACFRQARSIYESYGVQERVAWMDGMLAIVAQRQGRLMDAVEGHTRAMETYRALGDPYHELRAASGLATTLWMAGDYAQAQAIFEQMSDRSRQTGDRRIEEAALANRGSLADILGDFAAAVELKEAALVLSRSLQNRMGVALGLSNLGITYYKLGQYDRSLEAFDEALAIDRASQRRQGEAYSLHGKGVTLRAMDRLAEAHEVLVQARTLRDELAERDTLAATEADLALVLLDMDEVDTALGLVQTAQSRLESGDRADLHELVHYAAYRILQRVGDHRGAAEQLRAAATAMAALADTLPEAARDRFLHNDPLNREVRSALTTLVQRHRVRLVRVDVPLGRRLSDADYVLVDWTIYSPEDDRIARSDERRRTVMRRLIVEAKAQGAAPTDADLARVLNVSRRTVLRDIEQLAHAGTALPTRRRRVSQ